MKPWIRQLKARTKTLPGFIDTKGKDDESSLQPQHNEWDCATCSKTNYSSVDKWCARCFSPRLDPKQDHSCAFVPEINATHLKSLDLQCIDCGITSLRAAVSVALFHSTSHQHDPALFRMVRRIHVLSPTAEKTREETVINTHGYIEIVLYSAGRTQYWAVLPRQQILETREKYAQGNGPTIDKIRIASRVLFWILELALLIYFYLEHGKGSATEACCGSSAIGPECKIDALPNVPNGTVEFTQCMIVPGTCDLGSRNDTDITHRHNCAMTTVQLLCSTTALQKLRYDLLWGSYTSLGRLSLMRFVMNCLCIVMGIFGMYGVRNILPGLRVRVSILFCTVDLLLVMASAVVCVFLLLKRPINQAARISCVDGGFDCASHVALERDCGLVPIIAWPFHGNMTPIIISMLAVQCVHVFVAGAALTMAALFKPPVKIPEVDESLSVINDAFMRPTERTHWDFDDVGFSEQVRGREVKILVDDMARAAKPPRTPRTPHSATTEVTLSQQMKDTVEETSTEEDLPQELAQLVDGIALKIQRKKAKEEKRSHQRALSKERRKAYGADGEVELDELDDPYWDVYDSGDSAMEVVHKNQEVRRERRKVKGKEQSFKQKNKK